MSKKLLQYYISKMEDGGKILPRYEGGKPVPAKYAPLPRATDIRGMRPITPMLTEEEARVQRAFNNGTIRPAQAQNKVAKALAIAANPATAASYVVKGQRIPDNFDRAETNRYDMATSIVNPFSYLKQVADTKRDIQEGNYGSAAINAMGILPTRMPNFGRITSANLDGFLGKQLNNMGRDLRHLRGNNNEGVFLMRDRDDIVIKLEDAQRTAHITETPDFANINMAEKMRGIPDNLPISKTLYQLDDIRMNGSKVPLRASFMNRVRGVSGSELKPSDFVNIPETAYQEMYNNLKLLRNNDLAYDYFGNNYLYNPNTRQFGLFDIGMQPKKTGYWADEVYGASSKELYGVEKSAENIKNAMREKFAGDFRYTMEPEYDAFHNGQGKFDFNTLQAITAEGSNRVSNRIRNSLKDLNPFEDGGEKDKEEPIPFFKTEDERKAYKDRLRAEGKRALEAPSDEKYLINTAYSKIAAGNNCINGVCGLNIASGLNYNDPADVDRYVSNQRFAKNVIKGKEDYYRANGNFDIGDHIQYVTKRGKPKHSKIIYDITTDQAGNKQYHVIHNGGTTEFYEDVYNEQQLKDMVGGKMPADSYYKGIHVYRPGYQLDKEKLKVQRKELTSPEARQAMIDRSNSQSFETQNDPNYVYSIRQDSPYYQDQPEGMQEFVKFANDKEKIDAMIPKLDKVGLASRANKDSIHDSLLNVFGILGQENKWKDPIIGGDLAGGVLPFGLKIPLESAIEKVFKPKSWSLGPGQIKFDQIDPEMRKEFGIERPRDLYDWNKLLPLMVAMDSSNRSWMDRQGKNFSERIVGEEGLSSNEMAMSNARMSPYFWQGPGISNLRKFLANEYDNKYGSYRMNKRQKEEMRESYIGDNIRKMQKVFDQGSYGQRVFDNIDQNLQRTSPTFGQERALQEVVVSSKKRDGGLLTRTISCSNCGHSWKSVDGGTDPMTCHKCGGMVKMAEGGMTDGPGPRPVYVSSPNDPRLRAYRDSLSMYNQTRSNLMSRGWGKFMTPREIENHFQKYGPYEISLMKGSPTASEWYARDSENNSPTGNRESSVSVKDFKNKVNRKILPVGRYMFNNGDNRADFIPKYKKPVQPVEYRKPEPVAQQQPQIVPAQQPVAPVQPTPPAYRMQGTTPVYGPAKSLIGMINPESGEFYPDYMNTAGRARVNQEDIDMVSNQEKILQYLRAYGMANPKVIPQKKDGGQMIKRADGSYSRRGLWDNVRDNKGSGKKPTPQMLEQERKIKAKNK